MATAPAGGSSWAETWGPNENLTHGEEGKPDEKKKKEASSVVAQAKSATIELGQKSKDGALKIFKSLKNRLPKKKTSS